MRNKQEKAVKDCLIGKQQNYDKDLAITLREGESCNSIQQNACFPITNIKKDDKEDDFNLWMINMFF
jgi:hypothetical protein